MKKKLLILFLFLLTADCFAQRGFVLSGNVPIGFDKQQVSLLVKDEIGRYTELTLVSNIQNDKFAFKGTINSSSKNAVLELRKGIEKYNLQFVLDTGLNQLTVIVKDQKHKLLILDGKLSLSNTIKKKIDSVTILAYADYRKNKKITQEYISLPDQERHQLDLDMLHTIQQYPKSYYALMRLNMLAINVSMHNYGGLVNNALLAFDKELQNSDMGWKISDRYARREAATIASKIGQKMLDFEVENFQDDKTFYSKNLVNKPYVLAFSATWCIPCQNQLPVLKEMYSKYKDKGLEVVYYNQDDNHKEWVEHIKKNKLTWISLSSKKDVKSISGKLDIHYIPTYLIIDKNGVIIYNSDQMDSGLKQLEDYIKKAL